MEETNENKEEERHTYKEWEAKFGMDPKKRTMTREQFVNAKRQERMRQDAQQLFGFLGRIGRRLSQNLGNISGFSNDAENGGALKHISKRSKDEQRE
jgi:hypothetical protein